MSAIDIKDLQDCKAELIFDEMVRIRGGKAAGGSVQSFAPDVMCFPSDPWGHSIPSVDELIQDAYSKFPDIFSTLPTPPSYPYPTPAPVPAVPVLDPGIGG